MDAISSGAAGGSNVFDVQDAQRLVQQCDDLEQIINNMLRVKESLGDNYTLINNNWESDTADRDSYLGGLSDDINSLQGLIDDMSQMERSLSAFARSAINAASNSGQVNP